jgi:hypothetical protein
MEYILRQRAMVSPRLKNSTEGETKPATYEHIGHLHGCQIRAVASATGTLWYMGVGKHAPSHHWCAKAKRELLLQVSIMHDGETGKNDQQYLHKSTRASLGNIFIWISALLAATNTRCGRRRDEM